MDSHGDLSVRLIDILIVTKYTNGLTCSTVPLCFYYIRRVKIHVTWNEKYYEIHSLCESCNVFSSSIMFSIFNIIFHCCCFQPLREPKTHFMQKKANGDPKKSLKIPKGQSGTVYQRRTDNTMAKRKSTKGQTIIYKTLHRKIKIEHHEPH